MHVLFVCTGNICRSPMAEAIFRSEAERRGATVEVSSAGTWGQDGSGATTHAGQVLRTRGIDLDGHRARTATAEMLAGADLIVGMTSVHLRELADLDPDAEPKIRLLKELTDLEVGDLPGEASPERRLEALLAATRPPWRRAMDLDDPYGLPLGVYERTAQEIEQRLTHLADLLFGKEREG